MAMACVASVLGAFMLCMGPTIAVRCYDQKTCRDNSSSAVRGQPTQSPPSVADASDAGAAFQSVGQRRVYIDLGANWANTLRLYRDIADSKEVDKGPWEIYAFEASPLIVPYCDKFVSWLNGRGPQPPLRVPPAGSSSHLVKYAARYGCPAEETDEMRSCMWQIFAKPLRELARNQHLQDPGVVAVRLQEAADPPQPGAPDRYTLIPAAAGAQNGQLSISDVTPEQMIRGGAHSGGGDSSETVPQVDVAGWLMQNFHEEDYMVVKSDIEGAEFELLRALMARGGVGLIDRLALECHAWAGDCTALLKELRDHGVDPLEEGKQYEGWDSLSGTDDYFPEDPRQL